MYVYMIKTYKAAALYIKLAASKVLAQAHLVTKKEGRKVVGKLLRVLHSLHSYSTL
jgi:hypothetical protein